MKLSATMLVAWSAWSPASGLLAAANMLMLELFVGV